ncbi:MAG: DUF4169 family protein [Robiginitomaculum sp.]|nr:DUF4169 family protein [Robiginitomaculum sp.]
MTDNIVNFKQAKKRAGYAKKKTQASENRKKFGRTKAEKRLDEFEQAQDKNHHEDRKLDE